MLSMVGRLCMIWRELIFASISGQQPCSMYYSHTVFCEFPEGTSFLIPQGLSYMLP